MLRRSLPPAAAAEKEAAMYFIGIDLGTSACKLLLVDEVGAIVNEVTHEYPLIFPHPGWSEQKPEDWWSAVVTGVPELLRGFDASEVAGIGSGGQMHGLVALDEADNVIRPAILWNDGRTSKEVEYLNNVIGKDRLSELTRSRNMFSSSVPLSMVLAKLSSSWRMILQIRSFFSASSGYAFSFS